MLHRHTVLIATSIMVLSKAKAGKNVGNSKRKGGKWQKKKEENSSKSQGKEEKITIEEERLLVQCSLLWRPAGSLDNSIGFPRQSK